MKINEYKHFLNECKHEYKVMEFIRKTALDNGYELFDENKEYQQNDKIIFEFNKLIALIALGKDLEKDGANMIISHMDSPRLDVIPNDPFLEKEDGVFCKVTPYGGIISQSWLDRPLVLIGKAYNKNGEVFINTEKNKIFFTISSLLPHLDGRQEMNNLKYEKLIVRMGHDVIKKIKQKYKLTKEDLQFADLSFVPAGEAYNVSFDKELIAGYGHDDRSCVFAELRAMMNSKENDKTKIALFTSYEETGSGQSSGAESEVIDDIFLELLGTQKAARRSMRKCKMISADVCAGFESNYNTHFEENCKVIVGEGLGIVPFLGGKCGNDATPEMRNFIKDLCTNNNIKYQIETTKVGERGGGTVSTFFGIKGINVIDCGVPVLAMHSPQELINKKDLEAAYKLYKVFFES